MQKNRSRWVIGIIALAVVLRVGFLLCAQPWDATQMFIQAGDGLKYHREALNLIEYGTFSGTKAGLPLELNTYHAPGYAFVLSLAYRLFGAEPMAAVLLQVLISCACCVLMFDLGRRFCGPRAGMAALLLFAVDPDMIYTPLQLYTETLAVLLIILSLRFGLDAARAARPALPLLLCAAFSAGAVYVRPQLQFCPLFFAAFYLFLPAGNAFSARLARSACFLLAVMVLLAPWQYRNYRATGSFAMTTGGDYYLTGFVYANLKRLVDGGTFVEATQELEARAEATLDVKERTPQRLVEAQRALAIDYLREHPLPFLLYTFKGAVKNLLSHGAASFYQALAANRGGQPLGSVLDVSYEQENFPDYLQRALTYVTQGPPLLAILFLCFSGYLAAKYAVAAAGTWWLARDAGFLPALFFIAYVFHLMAMVAFWPEPRFKMFVSPAIALVAGYGVERFFTSRFPHLSGAR